MREIPFNRPTPPGAGEGASRWSEESFSSDGPAARAITDIFRGELGVKAAFLTPSGTAALEMCALILGISPGDEVIIPSYTFVSTANAFLLRGARIVFADIREDTFNIDEALLPGIATPATKAVVAVHYAGVPSSITSIMEWAGEREIEVIEDNAHGLFSRVGGRALGSIAPLAAVSFHVTKNFQCGEGGALFVNDERFIRDAEIIREKGTDRSRFIRGEVDRYTWRSMGSSYLLAEPLAEILLDQLKRRDEIISSRRTTWEYYRENLSSWAASHGARLSEIPENVSINYHLFSILMPSSDSRDGLLDLLAKDAVRATTHYPPLHLTPMGRSLGGKPGQCPVAEMVYDRLIRLPLFTGMTDEERERVVETVRKYEP